MPGWEASLCEWSMVRWIRKVYSQNLELAPTWVNLSASKSYVGSRNLVCKPPGPRIGVWFKNLFLTCTPTKMVFLKTRKGWPTHQLSSFFLVWMHVRFPSNAAYQLQILSLPGSVWSVSDMPATCCQCPLISPTFPFFADILSCQFGRSHAFECREMPTFP